MLSLSVPLKHWFLHQCQCILYDYGGLYCTDRKCCWFIFLRYFYLLWRDNVWWKAWGRDCCVVKSANPMAISNWVTSPHDAWLFVHPPCQACLKALQDTCKYPIVFRTKNASLIKVRINHNTIVHPSGGRSSLLPNGLYMIKPVTGIPRWKLDKIMRKHSNIRD